MKKNIVYHVGLTSPPTLEFDEFEISCHPLLKVDYISFHLKENLDEMLKQNPVLVLMSKNSVFGLETWLKRNSLESNYFNHDFWTVGERTHDHLRNILGIEAFYPTPMTGKGLIEALNDEGKSKIILICGKNPQKKFINGLYVRDINFFHFPVYELKNKSDMDFVVNFQNNQSNYIVITSPSAIGSILTNLEINDLSQLKVKIISIGPTTTEAIMESKGIVFHESKSQNISLLYEELKHVIGGA